MVNLRNNFFPNLIFMLAVIIVPTILMMVASIGANTELINIFGAGI